jgi:hypothetical protein
MNIALTVLVWVFIAIGLITIFVYIASVYILYKAKKKAEKYVGKKADEVLHHTGNIAKTEIQKRYGK